LHRLVLHGRPGGIGKGRGGQQKRAKNQRHDKCGSQKSSAIKPEALFHLIGFFPLSKKSGNAFFLRRTFLLCLPIIEKTGLVRQFTLPGQAKIRACTFPGS
jgi:hypothetical protein